MPEAMSSFIFKLSPYLQMVQNSQVKKKKKQLNIYFLMPESTYVSRSTIDLSVMYQKSQQAMIIETD